MSRTIQVTFDCRDPDRLATFWAAALGYEKQAPPEGFADWPAFLLAMNVPADQWDSRSAIVDPDRAGPRLFFQRVPESKQLKNRVHLDVNVGGPRADPPEERRRRVEAEARRLVGLGATLVGTCTELGEHRIVLHDPEENELCLQ